MERCSEPRKYNPELRGVRLESVTLEGYNRVTLESRPDMGTYEHKTKIDRSVRQKEQQTIEEYELGHIARDRMAHSLHWVSGY